jgi:two-component system, OmpR family, sensor histidine kinase ChvG
LDIVGSSSSEERRRLRWALSLTAKTVLLALIFVLVPIFLYLEFQATYQENQTLFLSSVRDQGRVISQSLLPVLESADAGSLPDLGRLLSRFSHQVTSIKLLLSPAGGGGFYYVASWPAVAAANLEAERATLAGQGVLSQLAQHCRGRMPFSLIYRAPKGGSQIVTAVTPLLAAAGCWAVVSSFSADAFPAAHLGEPYWETPPVRVAALIYLVMAAITFSTLLSVRAGLNRFASRARRIREEGPDKGSFGERADLRELEEVGAEFDRMVAALHRSAAEIRRTAEDNAHAFKTPMAVIRQSLEPLRRALSEGNQRAGRALGLIESSLDRLDGLVASARRLDEVTADLLAEPRVPVDLERVVGRLTQVRSSLVAAREITITAYPLSGSMVLGTTEMIETVLEILLDNAVSFSPPRGEIEVRLSREGRFVDLSVSDQGPGVPADQLERIFDRYYSERSSEEAGETRSTYFGIGLAIARRNVEAMGGTIEAKNRPTGGLSVRVRLPAHGAAAPARG